MHNLWDDTQKHKKILCVPRCKRSIFTNRHTCIHVIKSIEIFQQSKKTITVNICNWWRICTGDIITMCRIPIHLIIGKLRFPKWKIYTIWSVPQMVQWYNHYIHIMKDRYNMYSNIFLRFSLYMYHWQTGKYGYHYDIAIMCLHWRHGIPLTPLAVAMLGDKLSPTLSWLLCRRPT